MNKTELEQLVESIVRKRLNEATSPNIIPQAEKIGIKLFDDILQEFKTKFIKRLKNVIITFDNKFIKYCEDNDIELKLVSAKIVDKNWLSLAYLELKYSISNADEEDLDKFYSMTTDDIHLDHNDKFINFQISLYE